jgi:hypothetical protein
MTVGWVIYKALINRDKCVVLRGMVVEACCIVCDVLLYSVS